MKLTTSQCKSMLFRIGLKHGVSPGAISTRLLSDEDKEDMLHELISEDDLDRAVEAWKDSGCHDLSRGFRMHDQPNQCKGIG